jgi:hypothetical protein
MICIFKKKSGIQSEMVRLNHGLVRRYIIKINKKLMRLKDILNITGKVIPYVGLFIGSQSFMMAKEAKTARIEQATTETNKLLDIIDSQQDMIINDQTVQNKIAGLSSDVSAQLESIRSHSKIMSNAFDRLKRS